MAPTSLSASVCPGWSLRNPMELPGECFHGTFSISPFPPLLHFCLFTLWSLQGRAHVAPKLAPNWQPNGTRNLWEGLWKQKTAEIPVRKSDVLTLALLLNQREKKQNIFSAFIMWTGVSRLSVKIQLQKEIPTEARGVQRRREEKREWPKATTTGKLKQPTAPFNSKMSQDVQGFKQSHKLALVWPEKKRVTA